MAVASPASAAEQTAKFSSSTIKLTTAGVTVKRNGLDPRTCTPETGSFSGGTSGNLAAIGNFGYVWFKCSGSTSLQMNMMSWAWWNTLTSQYSLEVGSNNSGGTTVSPWGSYNQSATKAIWTNGSGSTNSTLKFENAVIGSSSGGPITMTGTFTATTSSGGLLTLSH